MSGQILLWGGFNLFVLAMLALDLGLFHRRAHAVGAREATAWSLVWFTLAMTFNAGLYLFMGPAPALEFFTGYLIEKSLSVDNIFVFVLVFQYFRVPAAYQHRVLFWGILGALVMRAALIAAGATLLARFHWVIYLFGAFLVVTGVKMAVQKREGVHPRSNPVLRLLGRLMPMTDQYHGQQFVISPAGRWVATPLLAVLLIVETTDLVFALDSIPAIFAVTLDPFIVYTSNVFAILGLRALYFLLAGVIGLLRFLKLGLAAVLTFVGLKMLVAGWYHIPVTTSLLVVLGILGISVLASLVLPAPGRQQLH